MSEECQAIIERASSVKLRSAEIIWVSTDIEPVSFNRGYYAVDITFYYKIVVEAYVSGLRPTVIEGLATFEKRVLLCGSDGSAHIFTSQYKNNEDDFRMPCKTNMPIAVVEVVDPVPLNIRIAEVCEDKNDHCGCGCDCCIPNCVAGCFGGPLGCRTEVKRLFVSLGQYAIIRLERETQLLIPAYDFCIPSGECSAVASAEDPCELFHRLSFPPDCVD